MNPDIVDPSLTPETPVHIPTEDEILWRLAPEDYPNIDHLVFEDGKPVETRYIEKLYRLLTEPLITGWSHPQYGRRFLALANVGLFYNAAQHQVVVPDVLLSLNVEPVCDLWQRENRSYLLWVIGKPPEVAIEVVSDRRGGEDSYKLRLYARLQVRYYVIHDPEEHLSSEVLRAYELVNGVYQQIAPGWFPEVGLGLILWTGTFENAPGTWLRWCDQAGQVIPTGSERAEQQRLRAERLEARLRELGIEPPA
jgi:Uma2 family endonuclease